MTNNTILPGTGETYAALDRAGVKYQHVIPEVPLSVFGEILTATKSPIFQGSFEYSVDNAEINALVTGGSGTVTQANAMAVVSSGTTTGSHACLRSKRHARYKSGIGAVMKFTTIFSTPVAGTEQYAGLFGEMGSAVAFENGLGVGYNGTELGFHRFTNDVQTTDLQSAWDDPLDGTGASGVTINSSILANLNIWYIRYGYLGIANPELWLMPPTGKPILAHTMKTVGVLSTPHSYNPNYHFIMYTSNNATTEDMVMKNGSYAYFIEGETELIETHQPQHVSGAQTKTSVTTETAIFTVRNKALYAGQTNYIDALMELVSLSAEAGSANNLCSVRLVRDATIGGSPSWADINATDSVMEIDTAGTTVTGGKELIFLPLAGKNDNAIVNVLDLKIILAPGETITVAGLSSNSATLKASALWKELF